MADALAPFDLLPDELVLAILRKSVFFHIWNKHNFLINTIGNISARFRRLAADPTFWKDWNGVIQITGWGIQAKERQLKMVIDTFLGPGIESLELITGDSDVWGDKPLISSQDLTLLAEKCPKLTHLNITGFKMESWPLFGPPWSVEELKFAYVTMNSKAFNNVELHVGLPDIRVFEMDSCKYEGKHPIKLPDMSKCENLEAVGLFRSAVMPGKTAKKKGKGVSKGKCPFPEDLETLTICGGTFHKFDTDFFKTRLMYCDVHIGDYSASSDSWPSWSDAEYFSD